MSGSYRDLLAWQKAIDLVEDIYACTRSFPREEQFGLIDQLRCPIIDLKSHIQLARYCEF